MIKKEQRYPDYIKPLETDESGAQFWELLSRYQENIEEAARELSAKYGISEEQAAADLREFRQEVLDYFNVTEV